MTQNGTLTPTALGWVREDLDREMDKIRLQVEAISNNPMTGGAAYQGTFQTVDKLDFTFRTLSVDGPSQITSAMRRILRGLGDEELKDRKGAGETLMEAAAILPSYLDRLQSGHPDLPVLLLPLINRMRSLVGDTPISEGTVFSPLLDVELPELEFVQKPGFDEPFEFLTQRLFRQYESARQAWLEDQKSTHLLSPVQGICETMRHRVQRYDLKRLWWVATEVFGGLMEGHVPNDVQLRRLMARLALLINTMAEQGEDGIDDRTSTSITQALLFHVTRAKPGCGGVDLVQERFKLEELAPDSDAMMRAKGNLSGQDREMYESLSAAVQDELSIVKNALDLELRTGQADESQRRQSLEALHRLSDTLGMVGLSGPGAMIGNLVTQFEEAGDEESEIREAALVDLAGQLLLAESALEQQIETLGDPVITEAEDESLIDLSAHDVRRIYADLLDECVAQMHRAEESVRQRFDGSTAEDPMPVMEQIVGALELGNLPDAAALTRRLNETLDALLDGAQHGHDLDEEIMNIMAEGMAGLELYLAALRDNNRDTEKFTDLIEDRLTQIRHHIGADTPAAEPQSATVSEISAARQPSDREQDTPEEPQNFNGLGEESVHTLALDSEPSPESESADLTPEPVVSPEPATLEEAPTEVEPALEPAQALTAEPEEVSVGAGNDELPDEIDPELKEIFLEEYESVLQSLQRAVPDWLNRMDNADALTDIRRAFHTLKGSGRMVGANELGDFSWQIEEMLNALLEGRCENFHDASFMVRLAEASLPALRQRLSQEHAGLTRDMIHTIGETAALITGNEEVDWDAIRPRLPKYLAGLLPDALDQPAAEVGDDDEMQQMMRSELAEHLGPVRELMEAIAQDRATRVSEEQVRAVHTIAGALALSPEGLDAEVATALEALLAAQSRSGTAFTPDAMFTLISAVGQIQNRLERLHGAGDMSPEDEQRGIIEQLEQLTPQFDGPPVDVAATPEQAQAPSASTPDHAASVDAGGAETPSEAFDPGRSVFAGGGEVDESDLTFDTAASSEPTGAEPTDLPAPQVVDVPDSTEPSTEPLTAAPEDTLPMDQGVEQPAVEQATPEVQENLAAETEDTSLDAGLEQALEDSFLTPETPEQETPAPQEQSVSTEFTEPQSAEPAVEEEPEPTNELDQEIVAIFLEEAAEVLERSDSALNQWRDDIQELNWVRNLQREIHTFKGGARMSGLTGIGDYTHEMESLLERIAEKRLSPSLSAVAVLEDACDRLSGWTDEVRQGTVPDTNAALELLNQQITSLDDVTLAPEDLPQAPAAVEEPQKAAEIIPDAPSEPKEAVEEAGAGSIKVAAELLDRLVNASGEVSIYRSRLEQQVGKLKGNISDFDETINRLGDQFRKMDIEIEAQIRASYPDELEARGENFDPLELDEFSALQQATRSLQETVADLLNLQEMAEENLRASEQLITRQSRVSTELQEGLMKTRMVPFGSIAPRLRRIVRGAAKEEGKKARLVLKAVGTDELDRNVLEHITAPLEHMMRNAVAHGIEEKAVRKTAGKADEGEITITVESEATEFVIRITDDGGGINLDAIRSRAVERGLLDADAEPTRQQLYGFMMDSGFSTSSSVTRLAGRGVGMDVVNADIKQIGGSLEIQSEPGEGTQFTIRIPFTLAIMQAIGLKAGGQNYLLPLSSVVGVSRVLPADYRKLAAEEEPVYRFAGQEYPLLDMEGLLGEHPTPLDRDNVSLLILSAGDQKAAIRIPDLLPHREVVIKPVGPQISSVPGILGGSISGDGEVMVILDPGPLIRRAVIDGITAANVPDDTLAAFGRRLVMVVDDSITMRKVTSRVLENRDYDVLTARDGVDALEKLQDRTPDIMLFDIEMPRMDGYELTERVREDGRFRKTPIMMITSRAGQKHRKRAMEAGATAYLTKPYREDQLLEEVERLLSEELEQVTHND